MTTLINEMLADGISNPITNPLFIPSPLGTQKIWHLEILC